LYATKFKLEFVTTNEVPTANTPTNRVMASCWNDKTAIDTANTTVAIVTRFSIDTIFIRGTMIKPPIIPPIPKAPTRIPKRIELEPASLRAKRGKSDINALPQIVSAKSRTKSARTCNEWCIYRSPVRIAPITCSGGRSF